MGVSRIADLSKESRWAVPFLLLVLATLGFSLATQVGESAAAARGVVTVQTVKVRSPGNSSVGVVPFTDAIYESCGDAPSGGPACLEVGGVGYQYEIGKLEVTVRQWVKFMNTTDPNGRNRHHLYTKNQSSSAWPGYGQVNRRKRARPGHHYRVASKHWARKPFAFATFLSASRFANSLYNGGLLDKHSQSAGGFTSTTYRVRLSRNSRRGMYKLSNRNATRSHQRGFVVPSQDEWIKAAYFDPDGGGTYSYWKYPTNPGVFGDGSATAPNPTELNYSTGDVVNQSDQPLAGFKVSSSSVPAWCPARAQTSDGCSTSNPLGLNATNYQKAYSGVVQTVGQARTRSPWGTLDQGGNAVEWTDTITPPPSGRSGRRTWRRLHGGISNSTSYQMWPSAVGLQPQDNSFYVRTYPWLGIRIGVIGNLGAR